jgi:hypothetical protein
VTIDDALLWLNDRLGKNVTVWVAAERDEIDRAVVSTQGELRHWCHDNGVPRGLGCDEMRGLYLVGGRAALDLSNVRVLEVSTHPHVPKHLIVRLDENSTLNVIEQEDGSGA